MVKLQFSKVKKDYLHGIRVKFSQELVDFSLITFLDFAINYKWHS